MYEDEVLKSKIQNVCTIIGVGFITAVTIVGETNGFLLFKSISQLVSYAGYDVVQNQSGQHTGKTKISKKGNSHIRRALYFPALSAVSNCKMFHDFYLRIYENSSIKMKGYVAVQRKLLVLIYTLFKNDTVFDPNYLKNKELEELEEQQTVLAPL